MTKVRENKFSNIVDALGEEVKTKSKKKELKEAIVKLDAPRASCDLLLILFSPSWWLH